LIWMLATWRKGTHQIGTLFPLDPTPPPLPPQERRQRPRSEYRALGFLCECHPITLFAPQRHKAGALTAQQLLRLPDTVIRQRRTVCFLGWLITGKIVGTKQGTPMEFLSFEDETGMMECTLFAREYEQYCHLLSRKGPLLLEGYVEEEYNARTLTLKGIAAVG